jgi:hypothetical protein
MNSALWFCTKTPETKRFFKISHEEIRKNTNF